MGLLGSLTKLVTGGVGLAGSSPSTGGGLNAKLGALLPYVNGTTGTVLPYPSTSTGITAFPPNNAWGTSGFTTLQSSGTLLSHMLTGFYAFGRTMQLDIASGAAGAEVVAHTARIPHSGHYVVFPPVQWPVNERASFRVSGNSTSLSTTVLPIFAQRPA